MNLLSKLKELEVGMELKEEPKKAQGGNEKDDPESSNEAQSLKERSIKLEEAFKEDQVREEARPDFMSCRIV
jgi:hypothetical protein